MCCKCPQVMLDKEDVNHYVPIEQSSGCGHYIRGGEILSCLCVNVYVCVCVCVCVCVWWMHLCLGVSDCTSLWLCACLVRRTNFPVHLFTGFLQLRQGSVRGLHSDINSGRAGRRPLPHREGTYLVVCVYLWVCACVWLWSLCVCVRVADDDLSDTAQLANNVHLAVALHIERGETSACHESRWTNFCFVMCRA